MRSLRAGLIGAAIALLALVGFREAGPPIDDGPTVTQTMSDSEIFDMAQVVLAHEYCAAEVGAPTFASWIGANYPLLVENKSVEPTIRDSVRMRHPSVVLSDECAYFDVTSDLSRGRPSISAPLFPLRA